MRTSAALAAMILLADAAAQSEQEPQTVVLDVGRAEFSYFTSRHCAVVMENDPNRSSLRPLLSIFPDGRVDLYRTTTLPTEVSDVH